MTIVNKVIVSFNLDEEISFDLNHTKECSYNLNLKTQVVKLTPLTVYVVMTFCSND